MVPIASSLTYPRASAPAIKELHDSLIRAVSTMSRAVDPRVRIIVSETMGLYRVPFLSEEIFWDTMYAIDDLTE